MEFRTTINLPSNKSMDYDQHYMLIGSCFAQNMGLYFSQFGFSACINPFGIIYNPASIAMVLERIIVGTPFTKKELFQQNGLWNSWWHHGSFSMVDINDTLNGINQSLKQAHQQIMQLDQLIITFGSSWVYTHADQVVANCHKVPQNEFKQRRLSLSEIEYQYHNLFENLWHINPKMNITLTVSPIRYLGQGSLSAHTNKAVLLLTCETLCDQYKQVNYFPAYELLIDDLRDYRFYTDDMIHPTTKAIAYIWDQFTRCYFTKETIQLLPQIEKVQRALAHRPLHPDTENFKQFKAKTQKVIEELLQKHPLISFK